MNETDNYTSTILLNITDNLSFKDLITNPYFYGSSLIFIFLISCIITFIFILKSKKKFLFSTNL